MTEFVNCAVCGNLAEVIARRVYRSMEESVTIHCAFGHILELVGKDWPEAADRKGET